MEGRIYRFLGGDLSYGITVNEKNGGAVCSVLRDMKTGKYLFKGERDVFFLIARNLATGDEITVTSSAGWREVSVAGSKNAGSVVFSSHEKLPGVTVVITATGDGEFLSFDTELINTGREYSLYKCAYPALYFNINKNTDFFYPYGCGETKPSTITEGWHTEQSYPSYGASMQYLCFWNKNIRRGVYYGCHDPYPASKKLCCDRKKDDKIFCLKVWQLLSDITKGRNSQKLNGSLKLKAFDGDWYDAALVYRDFIENEANYCSDYGDYGKKDTPEWFKNIDCWFNHRVIDNEAFADLIIEQAGKLKIKPAIHLYYWHQIPYDNDYPHYFPMKPHVETELKKLHEAGIRVMPYINGRLWDTRDRGSEDFEFTSVAKPYAAKGLDGEPITETYASKESDGSPVRLAVMCPSATLWQDKVAELVEKLFEVGFDGVYIDQIAAAEAKPCTDAGHKHPAGGGEWWCRAYNTMLERIARSKPADRMLTTECTADPFLKHLDGYLTWIWIRNDQVPAFPAVFSDKIISYGTDYRGLGNLDFRLDGNLDEAGVRVFAAQSFLFGQQMGWITTQLFARMPHKDFFIHLVNERAKFRRYFIGGHVLRQPVITDDGGKIALTKCREAYKGYVESNCVNGMLWEEKSTGKRLLLLVNSGDKDVNADIKTILSDGKYNIKGDKETEVEIKDGGFRLSMPPLSLCYIEV
ncbi:MAG: DUF6259 domain-containing protein [Eubacteriales bacterium]|nr:DUF6259 domain-containing protein [Eubacteriales bacterium]